MKTADQNGPSLPQRFTKDSTWRDEIDPRPERSVLIRSHPFNPLLIAFCFPSCPSFPSCSSCSPRSIGGSARGPRGALPALLVGVLLERGLRHHEHEPAHEAVEDPRPEGNRAGLQILLEDAEDLPPAGGDLLRSLVRRGPAGVGDRDPRSARFLTELPGDERRLADIG